MTSEQLGLFSEDESRGGTEGAHVAIPPPPPAAPNSELIVRENRAVAEMELDLQSAPAEVQLESDLDLLEPYVEYSGSNRPISSATSDEIIDGLLNIVEIEGPVTGSRLQRAYVLSSGGQRVGRAIAKQLNVALTQAIRSNRLLAENPLNQAGSSQELTASAVSQKLSCAVSVPGISMKFLRLSLLPQWSLLSHIMEPPATMTSCDTHCGSMDENLSRRPFEKLWLRSCSCRVSF